MAGNETVRERLRTVIPAHVTIGRTVSASAERRIEVTQIQVYGDLLVLEVGVFLEPGPESAGDAQVMLGRPGAAGEPPVLRLRLPDGRSVPLPVGAEPPRDLEGLNVVRLGTAVSHPRWFLHYALDPVPEGGFTISGGWEVAGIPDGEAVVPPEAVREGRALGARLESLYTSLSRIEGTDPEDLRALLELYGTVHAAGAEIDTRSVLGQGPPFISAPALPGSPSIHQVSPEEARETTALLDESHVYLAEVDGMALLLPPEGVPWLFDLLRRAGEERRTL